MHPIHLYSETQPLKEVLLHRPGRELDHLTPELMEELLFDEIPFTQVAQEEHDAFAHIFRSKGIQVTYLEDLMAQVLQDPEVKEAFIDQYIQEAGLSSPATKAAFKDFLLAYEDEKDLVLKTMEGTRTKEIPDFQPQSLSEMVFINKKPFFAAPMPNLYFTRDPFSFIGQGVSLNKMWSPTRNRETIYGEYIFKHHPRFKTSLPRYYNRQEAHPIEGGDILILSETCIAVGISQRTTPEAIMAFSQRVLQETSFTKVLAIQIPNKRAFMHLDTVFTMIDRDLFTIHPLIQGPLLACYSIQAQGQGLKIEKEKGTLETVLSRELDTQVYLLPCGGGDPLDASREQWNDGSNTLAIAPREVIVYDRNVVTNQLLIDQGVTIHTMVSGELSRGRGGPRCMSMPMCRQE